MVVATFQDAESFILSLKENCQNYAYSINKSSKHWTVYQSTIPPLLSCLL